MLTPLLHKAWEHEMETRQEPEITKKIRNVCQSYIDNPKWNRRLTGNIYAPFAETILDYFNATFVNASDEYMEATTIFFTYALQDLLGELNSVQFSQLFHDEFDNTLSNYKN